MASRRIVEEIIQSGMMLIKFQPFQCIQVSTYIASCMLARGISAKCVYGDLKYHDTWIFKNALTCHLECAPVNTYFDGHAWVEWDSNGVSYIIDASILFTAFSDAFKQAQPIVFYVFQHEFEAPGCIFKTQEEVLQKGLEYIHCNTLSNEFVRNFAESWIAKFENVKTAGEYQKKLQGA